MKGKKPEAGGAGGEPGKGSGGGEACAFCGEGWRGPLLEGASLGGGAGNGVVRQAGDTLWGMGSRRDGTPRLGIRGWGWGQG